MSAQSPLRDPLRRWNELFKDERHILEEPDILVIHFARLLREYGAQRILDWGCGAGRHVVFLARRGFRVVGRDPSPTGIAYARNWLEREGLQADVEVAPPGHIPFEDASFDAALSLYAVEHADREGVRRAVAEMRRVLRPAGLALITLTSGEDSLRYTGFALDEGLYAPREGPEAGVPHYLTTRADIDEFFVGFEILELDHLCSRLAVVAGRRRNAAHWAVIGATRPN